MNKEVVMHFSVKYIAVAAVLTAASMSFSQESPVPNKSQAADTQSSQVNVVKPRFETAYWGTDPLNCRVMFSMDHSDLLDVYGLIPGAGISGGVEIDDRDFTKSRFNIVMQADKLTTNSGWDNMGMIKGAEGGLDVAKYPTITFVSNKITQAGKRLKVIGALTLHGVTRDVTLDVDRISKIVEWEGNRYRSFQGTTVINRQDFGINWVEPEHFDDPIFGNKIKITVIIEVVNPPLNESGSKP
jgi:polyisoprenoid-binding protein YceI